MQMGLPEFLARFGGTDATTFAEAVRVPHLVFPAQPEAQARLPFLTMRRRGGKARESLQSAGELGLYPLPTEVGRLIALGRSPGNDLVIRSREISKVHCFVRRASGEAWEISDADSVNGTCRNGVPIEANRWVPLQDADVLLLADFLELHVLAPRALHALLEGLRSVDAPARDLPRSVERERRFLAVVREGQLRETLEYATMGRGDFRASALWSDLAPLIWSAEAGDVVFCEADPEGLTAREFCGIVAKHKPEVELIYLGTDLDLPSGVTSMPPDSVASYVQRKYR